MHRWLGTFAAVAGCSWGVTGPTELVGPDAVLPLCFHQPGNYASPGCVANGLVDLLGTWHVTGQEIGNPTISDLRFDMTFAPGTGNCLYATTTMEPPVISRWADPAGDWLVGATAAGKDYSTSSQVFTTGSLCVDDTTLLPKVVSDLKQVGNGHDGPFEGIAHFEGTLAR